MKTQSSISITKINKNTDDDSNQLNSAKRIKLDLPDSISKSIQNAVPIVNAEQTANVYTNLAPIINFEQNADGESISYANLESITIDEPISNGVSIVNAEQQTFLKPNTVNAGPNTNAELNTNAEINTSHDPIHRNPAKKVTFNIKEKSPIKKHNLNTRSNGPIPSPPTNNPFFKDRDDTQKRLSQFLQAPFPKPNKNESVKGIRRKLLIEKLSKTVFDNFSNSEKYILDKKNPC